MTDSSPGSFVGSDREQVIADARDYVTSTTSGEVQRIPWFDEDAEQWSIHADEFIETAERTAG